MPNYVPILNDLRLHVFDERNGQRECRVERTLRVHGGTERLRWVWQDMIRKVLAGRKA